MTAQYHTDAPKPYVHPVTAPGGRTLTRVSPPDHPWMRGLWFAVKFVDGVNFWEEAGEFGRQVQRGDQVDWIGPDGRVRLREERTVICTPNVVDWTSTVIADHGAVLDRTPYTTWGGYGGLAFRGHEDWDDTRILLDDGCSYDRPTGQRSRWADLSGPDAGVAVLDHPSNVRHPVPWYGGTRSPIYGPGWGNFLNAALLFEEPMTLAPDTPLTLRYRVVVHDGSWGADQVEAAWTAWVEGQ